MNQPKHSSRRQTTRVVVLALLLVLLAGGSGRGVRIDGAKSPTNAQVATLGVPEEKAAGFIACRWITQKCISNPGQTPDGNHKENREHIS